MQFSKPITKFGAFTNYLRAYTLKSITISKSTSMQKIYFELKEVK